MDDIYGLYSVYRSKRKGGQKMAAGFVLVMFGLTLIGLSIIKSRKK